MAWQLRIARRCLCMPPLHVTMQGMPWRALQPLTHTYLLQGLSVALTVQLNVCVYTMGLCGPAFALPYHAAVDGSVIQYFFVAQQRAHALPGFDAGSHRHWHAAFYPVVGLVCWCINMFS